MRNEVLLKYSRPVPRYTSYPTAPQFTSEVDSKRYQRWLGELGPSAALSLYFHVPFCRSLCLFCGCNTTVVNRPGPARAYADLLRQELGLAARAARSAGRVCHVHWGGGTPTELGEAALGQVVDLARELFVFREDAEIAIELDPRTLRPALAKSLAAFGFNRASLGIQDMDSGVQMAVNRRQPMAVNRAAVDALRSAGIDRINVDLMVGLPHQTSASVERSISSTVAALGPDRVAVFSYAHVPWMKPHQRLIDETTLPDLTARLLQTQVAERTLVDRGYVRIGLDHFAMPDDPLADAARAGDLRRNFQGYVTDRAEALLGIGASAISSLPQGYVQNMSRVPEYRRAITAGDFAVKRGVVLTVEDRARRDVIERLMCDLSVDLRVVADRWNLSPSSFSDALTALAPMIEDGIVDVVDRRIEVSAEARPVLRSVCAAFDTYLQGTPARYSPGV